MSRLFLKPARPGLIVADPATRKPLPDDGAWVENGFYWRRRLTSAEVIDDSDAQTRREAAAAKPAKKDPDQ